MMLACCLLLSGPISAEDLIINQGDAAIFSGVLVSPDSYKQFELDSELLMDCEKTLGLVEPSFWERAKPIVFFLVGFGVGAYVIK